MKMRETWKRTVRLTIEEVLMDVPDTAKFCGYEHTYTIEAHVQVNRVRGDSQYGESSQRSGFDCIIEDCTIDKVIQHDADGEQLNTWTEAQAMENLRKSEWADIVHEVDVYIDKHYGDICGQAADDELGAYEYAQEQRFQAMRDGE